MGYEEIKAKYQIGDMKFWEAIGALQIIGYTKFESHYAVDCWRTANDDF